jgi:hypothetical protein
MMNEDRPSAETPNSMPCRALQVPCERGGAHEADRYADDGQAETLSNYVRRQLRTPRPECHPHTNFFCAARHVIRENAVRYERREQQRQPQQHASVPNLF